MKFLNDARTPFPAPWSVDELEACLVVKDGAGQKLAYVYFEDERGGESAAKLLERDEARRIAFNIAKLPELLRRHQTWDDEDAVRRRLSRSDYALV